jgi:beta-lactamase superfamily II metal-dependent hydrolase
VLVAALLVTSVVVPVYAIAPPSSFRIHSIYLNAPAEGDDYGGDAGGESTLFESDGQFLLVDVGMKASSDKLIAYLKSVGATSIDVLITHMHLDHSGALQNLIKSPDILVNTVYMPSPTVGGELEFNYSNAYDSLENLRGKTGAAGDYTAENFQIAYVDKNFPDFYVGSAIVDILGPVGNYSVEQFLPQDGIQGSAEGQYLNNCSVSLIISGAGKRLFIGGDIEKQEEANLLATYGSYLDVDFLKISHHGLPTSSTAEFMAAATPTYSFIANSGYSGYYSGWTPVSGYAGYYPNSNGVLQYRKVQTALLRASVYGFVYLTGDEKKSIVFDSQAGVVTMRPNGPEGAALTGWISVLGGDSQYRKTDNYYIDPNTGLPQTGYKTINGEKYYLGTGGRQEFAFYNSKKKYEYWRTYPEGSRYFSKTGQIFKGLKELESGTYLFDKYGFKKLYTQKISGKYYYFGNNGKLQKDLKEKTIKISGFKVPIAKDGSLTLAKPAPTKTLTVTSTAPGTFTYRYNKVDTITGYEIKYSTSKNFTANKTFKVLVGKGSGKTNVRKKVVRELKEEKNYYVQIRTYRDYGGLVKYSKYTPVMKVKTL